ncbi:MAG: hypothetical protein QOF76_713 [Solirubrobacteraceae bacterium]|jgi:diguanylate cyclase (GGDEF)-like protein|nr:hypothetical protein [Solirubrobacteraceae bacterium]
MDELLPRTSVEFIREQQAALELIATGAPLPEILECIVLLVERHVPDTLGSVLIVPDGVHLRHGAAPRLPAEYLELIDGLPIGPTVGSCGTAMYLDQRVVVSDIEHDPLWEQYRAAALPFGLRACWSTPLHSSSGRVLGSFAMYYEQTREPTEADLGVADVASHLAGLAIERAWAFEQLARRGAEQAAIARISQSALRGGSLQGLLDEIAEVLAGALGGAAVSIVEHTAGESRLRAGVAGVTGTAMPVPGESVPWGAIHVGGAEGREDFIEAAAVVLATAVGRQDAEDRVRHQALHDPLTGLPNRLMLMSILEHALQRTSRTGGLVAVLLLDLDNFKLINDSLGHGVGDELLATLAPRLRNAVRTGDTIARLGGDEFVVVAEDLAEELDVVGVAERLLGAFDEALPVTGGPHTIAASVGIAFTHGGESTPGALLRDADAAMYRAKDQGGGRHQVFDAGMRTTALAHLHLAGALRKAVDEQAFRLAFQPIVSLADGTVIGSEALLRWDASEVGPAEFVPVAEGCGLIGPLGAWVLEQACAQAAGWDSDAWVSVNLSARQVASPKLVALVARILEETGLEPPRLRLEITETALVDGKGSSPATIHALADMGIPLLLDDFGTGFSSLQHLLHFPIHALKIDRSFVAELPAGHRARGIVSGVTAMAHELGKTVVAEGIETPEQLAILTDFGCDGGQGFLLGRPV